MDEQNTPMTPVTPEASQAPATQTSSEDPGKTLAIVGLVFSIIFALLGLVLCLIARNKSAKAGFKNTIATVGIIIAVVNMAFGVLLRVTGTI